MPKRPLIPSFLRAPSGPVPADRGPALVVVPDEPPRAPWGRRLRDHLEEWFSGLSFYVAGAGVCLLLAVLGFLGVRQSTADMLLWSGTRVAASEQRGVVFYTWDHRQHTVDVPGYATKSHLTVFLNPAHPDDAVTDSLGTRILDALLTVVPASLSVVIMSVGVLQRRIARRNSAYQGGYGHGLDPAVVHRLLAERRPRT